MGWEQRSGWSYYYHTYYYQGRKRRMYLGPQGDPVAELAAVNAALDHVNRELDRRADARELARLRNRPIIAGLDAAVASLARMLTGHSPGSGGSNPGANEPKTG